MPPQQTSQFSVKVKKAFIPPKPPSMAGRRFHNESK
jgi:hypothetical protein